MRTQYHRKRITQTIKQINKTDTKSMNLQLQQKQEHTLPYLPVGSTSTNSESSNSKSMTPFIPCKFYYGFLFQFVLG